MAKYGRPRPSAAARRAALSSAFLEEQEDDEMEEAAFEVEEDDEEGGFGSEDEGGRGPGGRRGGRGRRVLGDEEEVRWRWRLVGCAWAWQSACARPVCEHACVPTCLHACVHACARACACTLGRSRTHEKCALTCCRNCLLKVYRFLSPAHLSPHSSSSCLPTPFTALRSLFG